MRAHVLLCDHAMVADGKLFIQGAGISQVGHQAPTGIAVLIYVPWDQTNRSIPYRLELVTEDGSGHLHTIDGSEFGVLMEGTLEVGRPPGVKPGTPIEVCYAQNMGPMQEFAPGRYQWSLTIDGETNVDWTATFDLRDE